MLTLFEYLRKRAFEAVIDGTEDALEFLESQKSFDQSQTAENTLARRRPNLASDSVDRKSDAVEMSESGEQGAEERLPPPRRRGRPRKNVQAEK